MPTIRPSRRRGRKPKGFTDAELQLLTGRRADGVNRFAWSKLTAPSRPDELDAVAGLLDRAAGVVSEARLAELREWLDGCRSRGTGCCPLPPMAPEFCEQAEAAYVAREGSAEYMRPFPRSEAA